MWSLRIRTRSPPEHLNLRLLVSPSDQLEVHLGSDDFRGALSFAVGKVEG